MKCDECNGEGKIKTDRKFSVYFVVYPKCGGTGGNIMDGICQVNEHK
jgi:DnaJ-class molecular chaperone